jgi:hypothetical protein
MALEDIGNLRCAIDDAGNRIAEFRLDVFDSVVSIFGHIV